MIKRTPKEWAEFTGCWVAMDGPGLWYAYNNKPEKSRSGWASDFGFILIPGDFIADYSGDWEDSLAAPPEASFRKGLIVVRRDFPRDSNGKLFPYRVLTVLNSGGIRLTLSDGDSPKWSSNYRHNNR